MAAEEKCDCPAGAPLWMTTFGDMMSLLLTFFILIVSFSSIQEVEFQKAVGSLKGALGVLSSRRSTMNLSALKNVNLALKKMAILFPEMEEVRALVEKMELQDAVQIEMLPNSIKFSLQDNILFALGRADLKPAVFPVLYEIAQMTRKSKALLRIEGHTDDLPIRTRQFPSNWELSSMRAINVLHYFENLGIPREKLFCAGYADTRPRVPNTSDANRARNRRVEIYLELESGSSLSLPDSTSMQKLKYLLPEGVKYQMMRN